MKYEPSYENFQKIIIACLGTGKLTDFIQAEGRDNFIILRHDVEFSLNKAETMAQIEAAYGVSASYFVQVGNNAYNSISDENLKIISKIEDMGHKIGLHYRENSKMSFDMQLSVLQKAIGHAIDRFSTHRPSPQTQYNHIYIPGIINAYADPFFTRTTNPEEAKVKYISDSSYRWNYGAPDAATLQNYNKIQLLIHPFQWSEKANSMEESFLELEMEKRQDALKSFHNEYDRYREIEVHT